MKAVRTVAVAAAGLVAGWALATVTQEEPAAQTAHQVIVRTVEVEVEREPEPEPEPLAEVGMSVEEYERETECLWEFMQKHDLEMSPGMVLAATESTRMFGGACYLMGDDDE